MVENSRARCFTATPLGLASSQATLSSLPFHPAGRGFDVTCTCTVALIILSVMKRSRKRVMKRAFRRARYVISNTPRFLGHLGTLVQSTPRVLRCSAVPDSLDWSNDAFDPCSPETSPVAAVIRANSEPEISNQPRLPIQRRAKTMSAKCLQSLKLPEPDVSTNCESEQSEPGSESESPSVPSLNELGDLFDRLTESTADVLVMREAAQELKQNYGIQFQSGDGDRLYDMLQDHDRVDRPAFCSGLRSFLLAARAAERQELSLTQLRLVLATAFERLDIDGNGSISVEEFLVALRSFEVRLSVEDAAQLLRFLGSGRQVQREDLADAAETAQVALQKAQEKMAESSGWKGTVQMAERLREILEKGDLKGVTKIFRDTELLADATELATTLAATVLVIHVQGPHPGDAWDTQFKEIVENVSNVINSLLQSPMSSIFASAFLAALNAIRGSQVQLSEDEALLYARAFHPKGCSMQDFRKLLACGGCCWCRASEGDVLDGGVKILVRGSASVVQDGLELGVKLGDCVPAGAVAKEEVTYVAWDEAQLMKDARDERKLLEMLKLFQIHLEGTPRSPTGEPVQAALRLQAKRKGLSSMGLLTQSFRKIMESEVSWGEKFHQCRELVIDSSCDVVEGLEAVVDMAGACSAFLALSTQSSDTPDEWLQLTPLLILLSLILGQVMRRRVAASP